MYFHALFNLFLKINQLIKLSLFKKTKLAAFFKFIIYLFFLNSFTIRSKVDDQWYQWY